LVSSPWLSESPTSWVTGNIEGLFYYHWNPKQRLPLTAGKCHVGSLGRVPGTVEVMHHHRVETWIKRSNALDHPIS
jgi:hypothetical protein